MTGFRIAVLASGNGTNLQAILDRLHGRGRVEVVGVASDKPDAKALERAPRRRASNGRLPARRPRRPRGARRRDGDWLDDRDASSSCSPATCSCSTPAFVGRFRGPDHQRPPGAPAGLPGLDAIGQALAHGVRVTGVTVHLVDEGVDSGPILLQRSFESDIPRPTTR